MSRIFAVTAAVGMLWMAGCVEQGGMPSEATAEASSELELSSAPTSTAPAIPPVCYMNPTTPRPASTNAAGAVTAVGANCNLALFRNLIPNYCHHFVVISRAGSVPGNVRQYGVCTRPEMVVWQIESSTEAPVSLGGFSVSENDLLAGRINGEANEQSHGMPDFGIYGGGFIAKCCPPPPGPGGTDPRVLFAVAHNLESVQTQADVDLKAAGL